MDQSRARTVSVRVFAAALAGLCLVFFFNTILFGKFLWDDEQFVYKNTFLTSWRFLPDLLTHNIDFGAGVSSNIYRPLQSLTHFLDMRIWGGLPWGHRSTNVLLHAGAMVALFFMVLKFLGDRRDRSNLWAAFLAVLLFALHPLQSGVVGYVSGRGDTLMLLFGALSVLAFERYYFMSLGFLLLAILSKESALVLPVLFLGSEWVRSQREGSRARSWNWKKHFGAWFVCVAYFSIRLTWLKFGDIMNFYGTSNILTEHPIYRLFTYFSTVGKGLQLIFWPYDLHHQRHWLVYPEFFSAPVVFGAICIVLIVALIVGLRKRAPLISVGLVWFIAATIPTSNLLVLINALIFDHWFLVPALGFCLVTADLLDRVLSRARSPKYVVTCWALVMIPLTLTTLKQNLVWREPIRLFEHILTYEPHSAIVLNNLAMEYEKNGDGAHAKELYLRAITAQDTFAQTHHNLGEVYVKEGNIQKALEEFQKALAIDPRAYYAMASQGSAYLRLQRYDEAISFFQASISIHPTRIAYSGLIRAYRASGQYETADHYEREAQENLR